MNKYKTEQEEFWAGEFGDDYIERNKENNEISNNIALFSKIFQYTQNIKSVIEFGANIGLNLKAIKKIMSNIKLSAIEINEKAINKLKEIDNVEIFHQSILDFKLEYKKDFVFTKGVLIHINPEELQNVYNIIYNTSNKYICLIEYYNPSPLEVIYRQNKGKLFKRDFAGEMLDKFNDLKLIDYGFVYHRDNNFPQDDIVWFLMEKVN
jgi:spore coat polysaccharide biosynthesis protein SpsF